MKGRGGVLFFVTAALFSSITVFSPNHLNNVSASDGVCKAPQDGLTNPNGITGIDSGPSYNCLLQSTGNVVCYGASSHLPANTYNNGDAVAVAAGSSRTCILQQSGNAS